MLRALAGVGYDESTQISPMPPSVLDKIRLTSQKSIGDGWERLGKPGLGIWQEVSRREHALMENWVDPAIHALVVRAIALRDGHELEHGEVNAVKTYLSEDDDEIFAPSHTYNDQVTASIESA
jgi:hypothetical protein